VNPVDTKVRVRAAPVVGETKILGWDAVGVVRAVGKNVTLFRTRDAVYYAGSIARESLDEVAALVDSGVLKTTMIQNLGRIDAANLKRAHALLESGRTIGKVVLEGF